MAEIRVLELFAGIGACSKALTNLGIPHKIVDAVEIDPYAIKAFNAIHGTSFEAQDITQWDKPLENIDLLMHGSPCQDFSVAGKQKGGDQNSGTRSSLMYETLRIVEKLHPRVVIWENVKNLLSEKHRHNFDAYLSAMEELGYHNAYKVLNAKDFGVPQNRERVFTVSILKRSPFYFDYQFPTPRPLGKNLMSILEPEVDKKYYLTEKQLASLSVASADTVSRTVRTSGRSSLDRHTWDVVKVSRVGGLYDKPGRRHQAGSIYDANGIAATLSTMQGGNQEPIITGPPCVRRLTPLECWRLMSFDDADFDKAKETGLSDAQLYKQAGNSIVVKVLEAILANLTEVFAHA